MPAGTGATAAGRHTELPWGVFADDNGKMNVPKRNVTPLHPHIQQNFLQSMEDKQGKCFSKKVKKLKQTLLPCW